MDLCLACEAPNPKGYLFCGQCGAALPVGGCPACGAAISDGQQFCGQCGAALHGASPRSAPVAAATTATASPSTATTVTTAAVEERKLATVVFADVVGFTSLAERTDPELVARLVDTAFRELGDIVAEHGGTIDKYMGDSVMAVFGVPLAHDDDAERAVAAAMAMRHLGGDLVFSIGVNSGEVMATAVGAGGGMTVIGDTVNVAARLEKAAGPGEVLCGRLTTELTAGRIAFRARQPILLKGKQEPVEVWEAVSLQPLDLQPSVASPPLVGRDDELAFLEAQWRRVCRDRQTQVVVVCGDAGSGKTRVTAELARAAEVDGTVIRAAFPAYGAMGGARVAAEVIRQLGPVSDGDVNARVKSLAGEWDTSLQSIDPAGMHQEQLWALGRLLQEKGTDRPLLILIDDMHRSGDKMLKVLGELSGRLNNVAVLTVLAGRTEPGEWLTAFPAATTVRLGPLSRPDAVALADGFACEKPLSGEAADFLVERANGNPLYLRELVSMARTQGLLVDDGDRYQLTAHGAIPATLQALLAARLDALDPEQKLVLQHAAVMGGATAAHLSTLGSPNAPVVLQSLVENGLMRHGADARYDTVDSLLREVAYETLPRNIRGELHRRAATIVAEPEERARHLDRAAEYLTDDATVAQEAAEALARAGQDLFAAARYTEALRMLERAVALGCRRAAVLLDLAKVQALCSQEDEALETLAMVQDDPDDPTIAIERDHTAGNAKMFSDSAWAIPRLVAVTARWHELGVIDKEAWGHANLGVSYFNVSQMEDSGRELELGLELFERIGDRVGMVATSSFLCLARPTDRRVPDWLAQALAFADETGDRSRQLGILTTLAWHHFIRSLWGTAADTAEAEGFALRLAQLGQELAAFDLVVHGRSLLAIMARFTGRLDEAARHAEVLSRLSGVVDDDHFPWLGWAATFAVTAARGATDVAPPPPPESSLDPVVGMGLLVIEAELTVGGRLAEALARFDGAEHPGLGPFGDLVGLLQGLAFVLAGRSAEALPWVDRADQAAHALQAPATVTAAAALRSEITGASTDLPPTPTSAASVSEALVLRSYAARGDASALDALRRCAQELAMPGLLLGLERSSRSPGGNSSAC
ncbi:MAG: adenylate/guanylate cyclase domain-containing protein [Acidimicrobiales bacterium]